ncbi:hypothetical protein NliqN6_3659 [Naganishia liquefaciens]|uniref:DUF1279 domain-containing protein n=1 Tax=Naganishia liquefaciens TaxID=104408 RepID=A0A8H3TU77_9TREE|nr:hypothetical protein NliqN6_3659 [Naganishia liquefaciens]
MNRTLARTLPYLTTAAIRPAHQAGIRAAWRPLLTHPAQTLPTRIRPSRPFATTTFAPSSSSSSNNDSSSPPPPPPPSSSGIGGKLKDLMTKYGRHALAVYLALSAVDLGLTFLCVHLVGADKIEWVKDYVVAQWRVARYGADEARDMRAREVEEQAHRDAQDAAEGTVVEGGNKKKNKGNALLWAEFALAYGIHKTLLLPVRVGATAAVTPRLVHWLTARGWVGKGGVKRAATHASGKVKQASEKAQDRVKEASDRVKEMAKRTKD